jgi:hypothetical protein
MNGPVPPRWLPVAVVVAVVLGIAFAVWTFGLVATAG